MMTLKKMYLISATLILLISFVSCSSDDDEDMGNWVESSSFDGYSRGNSAAFVIGDMGYIVGGYDGDDYLFDLWEYHKDGDYWFKKQIFRENQEVLPWDFHLTAKAIMALDMMVMMN